MSLMGIEETHLYLPPKNFDLVAYKTISDGGAILGGGIEAGMAVISVSFDVQSTNGIIEVPSGWTNDGFTNNVNSTAGGAVSIAHRNTAVAESPNWFTNESASVVHLYAFPEGTLFSRAVISNTYWGGDGGSNAPPNDVADLTLVEQTRPCLIIGGFASTGSFGASSEFITYNGGNNIMRRDGAASSPASINTIVRLNAHPQGLAGFTGLSTTTFGMPDLGARNRYCGVMFWMD